MNTPLITANAHPAVIAIQPAPSALRALQQHSSHYAIAHQNEHHRAQKFPKNPLVHYSSTQSNDRVTAFFHLPYICSRSAASIAGRHVWSTDHRARNSSVPA